MPASSRPTVSESSRPLTVSVRFGEQLWNDDGVGWELTSFHNFPAGAYAERVPMLCIVGVPNTKLAKNGIMLHHTLGDLNPDFNVYQHCAEGITKAQAYLENLENATSEIDRVLRVALESVSSLSFFHPGARRS